MLYIKELLKVSYIWFFRDKGVSLFYERIRQSVFAHRQVLGGPAIDVHDVHDPSIPTSSSIATY